VTNPLKVSTPDFNIGTFKFMFAVPKVDTDLRYLPVACDHRWSSTPPSIAPITRTDPRDAHEQPQIRQSTSYLTDIRLGSDLRHPQPQANAADTAPTAGLGFDALSLRPRFLCFITDPEKRTYETIRVSDYVEAHGDHVDLEFIFVSYTRLQFRIATDNEIDAWDYPDDETREANRKVALRDRETLISWGVHAALSAGKRAFWLDFECVRDSDGVARSSSSSEDVYHICDIVRAAHSMIIAVGPTVDEKIDCVVRGGHEHDIDRSSARATVWLRQWGSRLWTLPEVLLCPNEYRIKLFLWGAGDEPKTLAKRNFAERAWDDAESVKELVDHYEGSAILTPLQLFFTSLECFARRHTAHFSSGDIAYAIMGLLPDRQRPAVNHKDSGFRAFARLTLATEGTSVLERLMCLAPSTSKAPWFDTSDRWGAKARDIHPSSRVVEVAEDDALVVDGLVGATIQWDDMDGSASLELLPSLASSLVGGCISIGASLLPWITQLFVLMALYAAELKISVPPMEELSLRAIIPSLLQTYLLVVMLAPLAFLFHRRAPRPAKPRKLFSKEGLLSVLAGLFFVTQSPSILFVNVKVPRQLGKARIMGLEGKVDAASLERHLWGFNWGRLKTVALDADEANTAACAPGIVGDERIFTLVDTYELTVTYFRSKAPPTALFIAGHEGGHVRGILCSFDWKSNTFHREKVLRLGSRAYDMMRPVDRIRLSMTRRLPASQPVLETVAEPVLSPLVDVEAANISSRSAPSTVPNSKHTSFTGRGLFLFIMLVSHHAR
jgi:hypothetical protein